MALWLFSFPLCFSLAILLSDLRNSVCIVPIDWGNKESGLEDCLSKYIRIGVFIASCHDGICAHFQLQHFLSTLEAKRPWFFIQGTSVMNGNICPALTWMGQGWKIFRSKEYNLSYFRARLMLSQTGILYHAVKLIWFPPVLECEFGTCTQPGCNWSLKVDKSGKRWSVHVQLCVEPHSVPRTCWRE